MPIRTTPSIAVSGVVCVVLDWPEHRNALDGPRAHELATALTGLWADPELRGVVITGNGAFCSGGDLRFFQEFVNPSRRVDPEALAGELRDVIYAHFQEVIRAVATAPVPVVAAVDGPAMGFGLDLALAGDARFISDEGWLMLGWERVGLIPGGGGLHRLVATCGPAFVWQLLADGRKITAADAAAAGLAQHCTGTSAVQAAEEFLERLGRLTRSTVESYVRLVRALRDGGLNAHLSDCVAAQQRLLLEPEFAHLAAQALSRGARAASTGGGDTV